jgi:ribonuclease HII
MKGSIEDGILQMIKAGIDEAGRGSLISRVYTGITILPDNFLEMANEENVVIRDSKKMTKIQRDKSRTFIEKNAIDFNVQWSTETEIDTMGIQKATFEAMHRCVDNLHLLPERLFVDGEYYENHRNDIEYECVVRGETSIPEIACASILAKTYRDEYIEMLCKEHAVVLEKYGISHNKGYGTKEHMNALQRHGFTDFHRKSFCKQRHSIFINVSYF